MKGNRKWKRKQERTTEEFQIKKYIIAKKERIKNNMWKENEINKRKSKEKTIRIRKTKKS